MGAPPEIVSLSRSIISSTPRHPMAQGNLESCVRHPARGPSRYPIYQLTRFKGMYLESLYCNDSCVVLAGSVACELLDLLKHEPDSLLRCYVSCG
jgi:hypothetical protein